MEIHHLSNTADHPGFKEVCKKISTYIDDSAVSRLTKADLIEAKENLMEAKQHYYQQLTIYTELQELLRVNNYGLHDQKYEDQRADTEIFKVISTTLSSCEAKNCLNISMKARTSDDEHLFGLSTEDFEMEPKRKKILHQNIQQVCIPLLEKRLKNKCLELFKFWNPSNKDSEGLALAKANQLAITLSDEKKKLLDAKNALKMEERKYEDTFQQNVKKITSYLRDLEEKVHSCKEKPYMEATKVTVDWLSAKCDYILTKIKVMKNHLYAETYTAETIEALQKVRLHLDQEILRTQNELAKTTQSLAIYESVGDSFTQMLTRYTQLTTQIDNRKWALSELQKNRNV